MAHNIDKKIAEALTEIGLKEFGWEASEWCPNGHSNIDVECGGFNHRIDDICLDCWGEFWRDPQLTAELTTEDIENLSAREFDAYRHFNDPTFHPEWRIGRTAHDFTLWNWLYPAINAWRLQRPEGRFWKVASPQIAEGVKPKACAVITLEHDSATKHSNFSSEGESEMEALREAFCAALEELTARLTRTYRA